MGEQPRPLFRLWPALEREVGFEPIGDFPTPVEALADLLGETRPGFRDTYVKRDDLTSAVYGGNKIRTLEPLFAAARRSGQAWIYSTGAYGSNHAVAALLHGKRLGFRTGAILFPQPFSTAAADNLRVTAAFADDVVDLLHWSSLPLAIWRRRSRGTARSHHDTAIMPGLIMPPPFVMPPGGAIPLGALGFLSAAFELGLQIADGRLPPPAEIVIAVGSTCSTAGLLLGLRLAAELGMGFSNRRPPLLVAVRVTPWPVTSRFRILSLSLRVARWLRQLTGDSIFDVDSAQLSASLAIDGRYLGAGYGRPTRAGLEARRQLGSFARAIDTTYSAKSAAALLDRIRSGPSAIRLFWSTKSSAPLPAVSVEQLAQAPPRMRRWLERARGFDPSS